MAELEADDLADVRSRKIGFVFQAFHLIPRLDALANISIPMLFAGVAGPERQQRASRALASVGLADWSTHRPAELSGGQKQRIAIARAIVMKPSLLLADEPTASVDLANQENIMTLIREVCTADNVAVLLVTHSPDIASRFDRIVRLDEINRVSQTTAAAGDPA